MQIFEDQPSQVHFQLCLRTISCARLTMEHGVPPKCCLYRLTNAVTAAKINNCAALIKWACGAAGSALPWHGRGRRFDPDQVHQNSIKELEVASFDSRIDPGPAEPRLSASRLAGKVVGSTPTRSTN